MKRRDFIQTVALGAGAMALTNLSPDLSAEAQTFNYSKERKMFTLTKLPYAFDALEPFIDARTVEIHHTKHHQSYVNNLNTALEKHPKLFELSIPELISDLDKVPEDIRTSVRNNGGGVINHDMFFAMMGPNKGGQPVGKLAAAIDKTFGGFEQYQQKFTAAAAGIFGSGWAWLSLDADGKLLIETTPGHDTPLMFGRKPILVLDIWEHAYYLKHQNRRADSIAAWWNVIDWNLAEENFAG